MADTDRVSPGMMFEETPLYKSAVINDLLEMLAAYKRDRQGQRGGNQSSQRPPVQVANGSGSDLRRGHAIQISARATGNHDPLAPWFDATTPTGDLDQRIAILVDAVKDGAIGDAVVIGHCCAIVNVTDDTHKFAKAQGSSNILASAAKGPIQILDLPDETGEQELWVNILGSTFEPPHTHVRRPGF